MHSFIKKVALAGAAVFALAGTARADVIIETGNNPGDTQNVLFGAGQSCSGAIGPAATVQGCLNQTRDQLVNLSTTGDSLEIEARGSGQANLISSDGTFDDLTISLAGDKTFDYLIFNIDVLNSAGNGTATFTAFLDGEDPFTEAFDIRANGENFFTVRAINDEALTSFRITSNVQLTNVNQIRIGGVGEGGGGGGEPVPEPAAVGLFGLGLIGLALGRRRKRA